MKAVSLTPDDVMTLREVALWAEVSKLTARQWTFRYEDHPRPWKVGVHGEPNLYLRADMEEFCRRRRLGRFARGE